MSFEEQSESGREKRPRKPGKAITPRPAKPGKLARNARESRSQSAPFYKAFDRNRSADTERPAAPKGLRSARPPRPADFGDDRPPRQAPSGNATNTGNLGYVPKGSNLRNTDANSRKPHGEKPFDRKPYGDDRRGPRPERGGFGSDNRDGDRKPYDRKPYGDDRRGPRPERSGFGSDNRDGDRKPYERKPQGDKPFDRKPYGDDSRGPRPERKFYEDDQRHTPENRYLPGASRGPKLPKFQRHDPNKTFGGKAKSPAVPAELRLNRYIALSGICSRREADEMIKRGDVQVNGQVVTEMGGRVNRFTDKILVQGQPLVPEKPTYILLNKPKNHITTARDPEGRRTVMDILKGKVRERVFPVGRLDRNTTGLLLLTNDGDLARKLAHPSSEIAKLYYVRLARAITLDELEQLVKGVELEDGFIKPDKVGLVDDSDGMELGIELHSGRNRVVRRLIEHIGHEVVALDRVMYGFLTKKGLQRGFFRHLTDQEVNFLRML